MWSLNTLSSVRRSLLMGVQDFDPAYRRFGVTTGGYRAAIFGFRFYSMNRHNLTSLALAAGRSPLAPQTSCRLRCAAMPVLAEPQ